MVSFIDPIRCSSPPARILVLGSLLLHLLSALHDRGGSTDPRSGKPVHVRRVVFVVWDSTQTRLRRPLAGVSEFCEGVSGAAKAPVWRCEQRRPPHDHLHYLL